jgi:hypothetical protein
MRTLDKSLDAARSLVHELRSNGLGIEADLVSHALDIASAAASLQHELYEHALMSLHDLACDRLDEIELVNPVIPEPLN